MNSNQGIGARFIGAYLILLGVANIPPLGELVHILEGWQIISVDHGGVYSFGTVLKCIAIFVSVCIPLSGVFICRHAEWARKLAIFSCVTLVLLNILFVLSEITIIEKYEIALVLSSIFVFGLPAYLLAKPSIKSQFT